MGWTDDQGHQQVPGHLFKLSYLRGGMKTKVTDECLISYSNCHTCGVDQRPRTPMGAWLLIETKSFLRGGPTTKNIDGYLVTKSYL